MTEVSSFFAWVWSNKEWLFSGFGVAILGWVFIRSRSVKMKQSAGDDSISSMGGRDSTIKIGGKDDWK